MINYYVPGYKPILFSEYNNIIQGGLLLTDDNLNMAIIGNGFFKVFDEQKNKYYYTRNGNFYLDNRGLIVTQERFLLYPPIKYKYKIDNHGLKIENDDLLKNQNINLRNYKIDIYKMRKPNYLEINSLYFECEDITIDNDSELFYGFLESSTVNIPDTIIGMMNTLETLRNKPYINYETKIFILKYILERYNKSIVTNNKKIDYISDYLEISNLIKYLAM